MLKFGILGAARIAPWALIEPASRRTDVEIVAVSARRPGAAKHFAEEHGVAKAYESYEALLDDASIDVVYNPLPPNLHAEWSIKALEAGKHVLCEKPFAMNAREAAAMQAAAKAAGCRIVEAFHDRYHPIFAHLLGLVESGQLGTLTSVHAVFNHTIPDAPQEFRRDPATGGGALLELGCYPVHWCRSLLQKEPEVVSADALLTPNGCDEEMHASLVFPSGVQATVETRMTEGWKYHARFTIVSERGSVTAENSLLPHLGHSIIERLDGKMRQYTIAGLTTFDHQLDAFVTGIRHGVPLPTEGHDSLGNMTTIDAIYAKAGVNRPGGQQ
jgi:predicted dehydrogenase